MPTTLFDGFSTTIKGDEILVELNYPFVRKPFKSAVTKEADRLFKQVESEVGAEARVLEFTETKIVASFLVGGSLLKRFGIRDTINNMLMNA